MLPKGDTSVSFLVGPSLGLCAWFCSHVLGFLALLRAPLAAQIGEKAAELLTTPIVFAALIGFAGVCLQLAYKLYESELRRAHASQVAQIRLQAVRIAELEQRRHA